MMMMVNMVTMFVNSFRVQTKHDKATGLRSLAELRTPSSADAIVTCISVCVCGCPDLSLPVL